MKILWIRERESLDEKLVCRIGVRFKLGVDRRLIRVMITVIGKGKVVVINRDARGPFEDRLAVGKYWLALLSRKFVYAINDIVANGKFRPIV